MFRDVPRCKSSFRSSPSPCVCSVTFVRGSWFPFIVLGVLVRWALLFKMGNGCEFLGQPRQEEGRVARNHVGDVGVCELRGGKTRYFGLLDQARRPVLLAAVGRDFSVTFPLRFRY